MWTGLMKCSYTQTAQCLDNGRPEARGGCAFVYSLRIRPRQLIMIPSASDLRTRVQPVSLRSKPAIVQNFIYILRLYRHCVFEFGGEKGGIE